MPRTAPLALVLMLASPALAAEPPAESAVATAAPKGDTGVAAQIAAFLADSPVAELPASAPAAAGPDAAAPRVPHGMVEVAVGNHGYRSVYLETQVPLGDNGQLSIAIGERRGGYDGYYGGYGRRLDLERPRLDPTSPIEATTSERPR